MIPANKLILRALTGPAAGKEFLLDQETLSLGRSEKNNIVLPEPSLLDLEAKIRWMDGRWVLFNCTPESKIFVGSIAVDRCKLLPGVHLSIGSTEFEILAWESSSSEPATESAAAKPPASAPPGSAPGALVPHARAAGSRMESLRPPQSETPKDHAQASHNRQPTEIPAPETGNEPLPSGLAQTGTAAPSASRSTTLSSAGSLLFTAFILAVVIIGIIGLQMLGRKQSLTPVQQVLIQEGREGEMISVLPYSYDQIGGSSSDEPWKRIVDAKPVSPNIMVELSGRDQGRAQIPLFFRGRQVLTLHVTVKGRARRDPVFRSDMNIEEVLSQAEGLLRQGRQLERDRLYEAVTRCYRPTAEFLEKVEGDQPQRLAAEARQLLAEADAELTRQFSECEQQFWQAYAIRENERSLRQLQHLLELVPDRSDKRHQRASIMAQVVRLKAATQ